MRDHNDSTMTPERRQAVGVRELKAQAARIVRSVRETRTSYVVTHRGRAVAVLLPIDAAPAAETPSDDAAWTAFLEAGRQLQQKIRPGARVVNLLSDSRR